MCVDRVSSYPDVYFVEWNLLPYLRKIFLDVHSIFFPEGKGGKGARLIGSTKRCVDKI